MTRLLEATHKVVELSQSDKAKQDSHQFLIAMQNAVKEVTRELQSCKNPIEIEMALSNGDAPLILPPDLLRSGWEKVLRMGHRSPSVLRSYAYIMSLYYAEFELENELLAEAERIEQEKNE